MTHAAGQLPELARLGSPGFGRHGGCKHCDAVVALHDAGAIDRIVWEDYPELPGPTDAELEEMAELYDASHLLGAH